MIKVGIKSSLNQEGYYIPSRLTKIISDKYRKMADTKSTCHLEFYIGKSLTASATSLSPCN